MRVLIVIAFSICISISIDMDDPRCYCWPDLLKELCERKYGDSKFYSVILAKVYGSLTPNNNTRRTNNQSKIYYNLTRVVYLGKMSRYENYTFTSASTPAHFNSCTVELNLGRSYLISGEPHRRELVMSNCSLHHPWRLGRNYTYAYLREVIATTCAKHGRSFKRGIEVP